MKDSETYSIGGTILLAEDNAEGSRSICEALKDQGYIVRLVESTKDMLRLLRQEAIDVVLLDLAMPGIDGVNACKRIRKDKRIGRMPVILVTEDNDKKSKIKGMKAGADDFLVKPVDEIELAARVHNLVLLRRYFQHLEHDRVSLVRMVDEQSDLLAKAMTEISMAKRTLRRFNEEIVFRLSKAVEFRDDETGNHVQRMSRYCGLLARRLEMGEEMCEAVRIASALHDVGKISVPDEILHKKGKLTKDEMAMMRHHSDKGYRVLAGSESNVLEMAATIAWTHHERLDGTGYPRKLKGDDIPIEGRIAAVADVFDALTSKRVYKPAFSVEKAKEIILQERGTGFDPQIVDCFFEGFADVKNIMIVYGDR